jgi:FkbM family methyltransferase
VDLGAADGNSFRQFLNGGYGPVANCPSGQWEALLVEANPQFTTALNTLSGQYPGSVHAYGSTAAYMCQGTTSFSIDPDSANNHWGSSMKRQFGSKQVTVPTINIMQLLQEHVTQGDWVMLKVDIEGAEYDLIPCLAGWAHPNLLDVIFVEEHHWLQVDSSYTEAQYSSAKLQLRAAGVQIPDNYHTHTL